MATVAQRVNEMRFALRAKGVPSEVTDHLDLKAHADPKLTASENVENFMESHGLATYTDRELRALEEQAEDEHIEHEVAQRLAEREAALVAEIKGEGCEECNHKLRALEKRLRAALRAPPRGQRLKRGARRRRVVATAKQKAAQERFKRAAAQAKREGAKGKNYAKRVGEILKGTASRAAKAARSGASGARQSVSRHIGKKASSSLANMTVGSAIEGYIVLDGLKDSYDEYSLRKREGRLKLDHWTVKGILAPTADAVAAAKTIHALRTSPLTAPLAKDLFNIKPLRFDLGNLMHANLGKIATGIPSVTGWLETGRRYKALRAAGGGGYTPRMHALLGVSVQNDNGSLALRVDGDNLLAAVSGSALAPAALGGGVSYVGSKVIHSAMMPAPAKRVLNLQA